MKHEVYRKRGKKAYKVKKKKKKTTSTPIGSVLI